MIHAKWRRVAFYFEILVSVAFCFLSATLLPSYSSNMMSQTEMVTLSEADTKFFADNLLEVEDWGDSICDIMFAPDELLQLRNDDENMGDVKVDDFNEFLSNLGETWTAPATGEFDLSSGIIVKEEPLSPSCSNSSAISLPSSPESQNLVNGLDSPLYELMTGLDSPPLTPPQQPVKTEATLAPICTVKLEKIALQPCHGVKPIQPMPVSTSSTQLPVAGVISRTSAIPVIPMNTSEVVSSVNIGQKLLKRQQRMIKNRESACLSRRKKKEYLQSLEAKLKDLSTVNGKLKQENETLKRTVEKLYNENTTLRCKHPELSSAIKKSTCVLAVVLFIALNFGPFGTLKDQWTLKKAANLLPPMHHGRALLQFEREVIQKAQDESKPLVFEPHTRRPLPSRTDTNKLNGSQEKLLNLLSPRMAERKDLMVIKNKWDFLGETPHNRRIPMKRKDRRKGPSRRERSKVDRPNGRFCAPDLNSTDVHRINEDLEGWVREYEDGYILRQKQQVLQKKKVYSSIREMAVRLAGNCSADVKKKFNRHMFTRKHNNDQSTKKQTSSSYSNAVQVFQGKDRYKAFRDEINKKADTFYFVSFHQDNLWFPATAHNETRRPLMSFMMVSPTNQTWKDGQPPEQDVITMMKIDCEVVDTKMVNVRRSSIPLPQTDGPPFYNFDSMPLTSPTEYNNSHP